MKTYIIENATTGRKSKFNDIKKAVRALNQKADKGHKVYLWREDLTNNNKPIILQAFNCR